MKDYYAILGVPRDASQEAIQKAFRKLAHTYHPDKKSGDVEKFKEVNEAYQILSNKEKRARYDAGGTSDAFQGFDFGGGGVRFEGFGGFSEVINEMFRGAINRGADIQINVPVTFREAIFGVQKQVRIPYRRKETATLTIPIPAGVEEGTVLRVQGQGEPSKDAKAPSGDLLIRIAVENNALFERRGGDLIRFLSLTPTEAILGTKKKIEDLKGEVVLVDVPEQSKEGSAIILSGRGIPHPTGTNRLIVLCRVNYPKSLSRSAKKLFESLQKEGW